MVIAHVSVAMSVQRSWGRKELPPSTVARVRVMGTMVN